MKTGRTVSGSKRPFSASKQTEVHVDGDRAERRSKRPKLSTTASEFPLSGCVALLPVFSDFLKRDAQMKDKMRRMKGRSEAEERKKLTLKSAKKYKKSTVEKLKEKEVEFGFAIHLLGLVKKHLSLIGAGPKDSITFAHLKASSGVKGSDQSSASGSLFAQSLPSATDPSLIGSASISQLSTHSTEEFAERECDGSSLRNANYVVFLKLLDLVSMGLIKAEELCNLTCVFFESTDISSQLRRLFGVPVRYQQGAAMYASPLRSFSLRQTDHLSVADSFCAAPLTRVTSSYVLAAPWKTAEACSTRDALCQSVLNDMYTSVCAGSEAPSHHEQNQSFEEMFVLESRMCLWDYYYAQNEIAIQSLRRLQTAINRKCALYVCLEQQLKAEKKKKKTSATSSKTLEEESCISSISEAKKEDKTDLTTFGELAAKSTETDTSAMAASKMQKSDSSASTKSEMDASSGYVSNEESEEMDEALMERVNLLKYVALAVSELDIWNEFISPLALSAIRRLYGRHTAFIRNALCRNPLCAIRTLLPRLEAKRSEWKAPLRIARQQYVNAATELHIKARNYRAHFRNDDKRRVTPGSLWNELVLAQARVEPALAHLITKMVQRATRGNTAAGGSLKEGRVHGAFAAMRQHKHSTVTHESSVKPSRLDLISERSREYQLMATGLLLNDSSLRSSHAVVIDSQHIATATNSPTRSTLSPTAELSSAKDSAADSSSRGSAKGRGRRGRKKAAVASIGEDSAAKSVKASSRKRVRKCVALSQLDGNFFNYSMRHSLQDFGEKETGICDTHEHCWNVLLDYFDCYCEKEETQQFVEFWMNFSFVFLRVELNYHTSFPESRFREFVRDVFERKSLAALSGVGVAMSEDSEDSSSDSDSSEADDEPLVKTLWNVAATKQQKRVYDSIDCVDTAQFGGSTLGTVKLDEAMTVRLDVASPLHVSIHCRKSHVFFGDKFVYTLLRMYLLLWERLRVVKKLAAKSHLIMAIPETGKQATHKRFFELLWRHIDGSLTESKFENAVFELLGTAAYELVTVKNLVQTLVKEFTAYATRSFDTLVAVVKLWKRYDALWRTIDRKDCVKRLAFLRQYHAAVCEVYGAQSATNAPAIVQIEYFPESKELVFQLVLSPTDLAAEQFSDASSEASVMELRKNALKATLKRATKVRAIGERKVLCQLERSEAFVLLDTKKWAATDTCRLPTYAPRFARISAPLVARVRVRVFDKAKTVAARKQRSVRWKQWLSGRLATLASVPTAASELRASVMSPAIVRSQYPQSLAIYPSPVFLSQSGAQLTQLMYYPFLSQNLMLPTGIPQMNAMVDPRFRTIASQQFIPMQQTALQQMQQPKDDSNNTTH